MTTDVQGNAGHTRSGTSLALVTGASGFVGRRLCRLLRAQGVRVRALHRRAAEGPWDDQVMADLGEHVPPAALDGVTDVFHLAGRAHAMDEADAVALHEHATVAATENLLDAIRPDAVRSLQYLSSTKAVADPGPSRVDESFDDAPGTPYGMAKRRAEEQLDAWATRHNTSVTVLRPPMIVGAGAKGNAAVLLARVRRGRRTPIPELGNQRSIVHVDDVAEALWHVSRSHDRPTGARCFFVAHERPYSTREMIDVMRTACGLPAEDLTLPAWVWSVAASGAECVGRLGGPRVRARLPLDAERWMRMREWASFSPARLARETGFEATRTLSDAVTDMLAAQEHEATRRDGGEAAAC